MSKEEEERLILNLFESFWFEHGVLFGTPVSKEPETCDKPKLSRITTLMRKSHSDHSLSSKGHTESPSPNSVLGPQLQTILSGKSFDDSSLKTEDFKPQFRKKGPQRRRRRRRSMSELESEELKGFMDLGFVFSDEDKDSRLGSIIPGLQRIGKNVQDSESGVSRPYLSEAWEDQRVMNLRIINPANFGNELELKDHLRCWAHNVASTVR